MEICLPAQRKGCSLSPCQQAHHILSVSVAAPADSEGAVSYLISHKTTVFKWAGLAAASEHKGFLLFPSS